MQVTHNAELAQRFGRKVRNLVDSAEYKAIFGDVKLKEDSKLLWKIAIQIRLDVDTLIHLTVS